MFRNKDIDDLTDKYNKMELEVAQLKSAMKKMADRLDIITEIMSKQRKMRLVKGGK